MESYYRYNCVLSGWKDCPHPLPAQLTSLLTPWNICAFIENVAFKSLHVDISGNQTNRRRRSNLNLNCNNGAYFLAEEPHIIRP